MPSVSSIRPQSSSVQSSVKNAKVGQLRQPSATGKADSVRFGNPTAAEDKIPNRGILALKNACSWQGLKWDAIWGLGFSIVSAIIPPHAHALMMFPITFAVGMTMRAVTALFSPATVHRDLQKAAQEAARKTTSK